MSQSSEHRRATPLRDARSPLWAMLALATCLIAAALTPAAAAVHQLSMIVSGYVAGGVTQATSGNVFCTTNGHSFDYDLQDSTCLGGCARRQGIFEAIREDLPETLTVDAGSFLWGSMYYNSFGAGPMIECMKRAKYDVAALSGRDLYAKLQDVNYYLNETTKDANPPLEFVSTNMNISSKLGTISRSAVRKMSPSGGTVGFISLVVESYEARIPHIGEVTIDNYSR